MKKLIYTIILLVTAQFIGAAEIPAWHVIKATKRGAKMIKIAESLYEYDSKFGGFPPTLYSLVTKGLLQEADLCLRNPDKSLSVPDYFPNLNGKSRADAVMLRAPSGDRSFEIIVRLDLSISGVDIKKTAEQDGAGQPATRPESKSQGSDKTQPDSEGRSR